MHLAEIGINIMPRKNTIKYNPSLSITENARRNGVSEAGIRYYIKANNIDRRYELKIQIVEKLRQTLSSNPNMTIVQIAQKTHFSKNTVCKYLPYAREEKYIPRIDSKQLSKHDLRQLQDYYATAPNVTRDILREEQFTSPVLEPCCGGGFMAEEIKKAGYEVDSFDIIDRGYGIGGIDFLKYNWEIGKYDIITNPPYTLFIPMLEQAMRIYKDKIAMLLPLRYLSSKPRYAIFKKYPPSKVYVYIERICIAKNGRFEAYESGMNLEIYAWYVWEKGSTGNTVLKWIHNMK